MTRVGAAGSSASRYAYAQRWPAASSVPADNPAATRWRANSARTSRYGSRHRTIAATSAASRNSDRTKGLAIANPKRADHPGRRARRAYWAAGAAGALALASAMIASTEPAVIGWVAGLALANTCSANASPSGGRHQRLVDRQDQLAAADPLQELAHLLARGGVAAAFGQRIPAHRDLAVGRTGEVVGLVQLLPAAPASASPACLRGNAPTPACSRRR